MQGMLLDRKVQVELNVNIYRTVEMPTLVTVADTWATTKSQERRQAVDEIWMLLWMCGVKKKDTMRNEHARGSVKVASVAKKITEKG